MNRKHVLVRGLLISLLACSFSGCASIMSDKKYEVTMDNSGGPTYFTVKDHKSRIVQSGLTPKQVTLPAKTKWLLPAKYNVFYAGRDGVEQHQLKARLDWWTAGNLVLGGVAGMAVDAVTGAMWKLDDRVTGQVPAQNIVSNESEGGTVLASYQSSEPADTTTANGLQPTEVRQASFGLAKQR